MTCRDPAPYRLYLVTDDALSRGPVETVVERPPR